MTGFPEGREFGGAWVFWRIPGEWSTKILGGNVMAYTGWAWTRIGKSGWVALRRFRRYGPVH